MAYAPDSRVVQLINEIIRHFSLDLSGLTIYGEAATGHYLFTPILAAAAGAKRVIAYTRKSEYGLEEEVREQTMQAAEFMKLAKAITITNKKLRRDVEVADIVVNSGFVRPIDRTMVSWMKPTAVIPLMWEPWEIRSSELDLEACRKKGIVVLGTNEHEPPCDMTPYSGLFAIKLLFSLGLEVCRTRLLLLGGQRTLGAAICHQLRRCGCEVSWFGAASTLADQDYRALHKHFLEHGQKYDAILVAEHQEELLLVGTGGKISCEDIKRTNPAIRIGVISGNVNAEEISHSGIQYLPARLRGAGYMSYQAGELGPRPVLELFAAGLKVGEAMSRARLSGLDVKQSIRFALDKSPALSFPPFEE